MKHKIELKPEHRVFAENYVIDFNGTRAYRVAYPKVNSDETAAVNASKLLRNTKVLDYIEEIQEDLTKLAGESALKVIKEYQKIAYSSLHNYKTDWFTLKEWENVSDDDKTAVAEVMTQTRITKQGDTIQTVKFKLHDKQKALDAISRMLGFYAPKKEDVNVKVEQPLFYDLTDEQLKAELKRLKSLEEK